MLLNDWGLLLVQVRIQTLCICLDFVKLLLVAVVMSYFVLDLINQTTTKSIGHQIWMIFLTDI